MSDWTAFQMRSMLNGVVLYGTGRNANWSGSSSDIGGKTGTTSEYRDAWFVGFVPGLVTGVWMGYDDNRPMLKVTGGSVPARLWQEYMKTASKNLRTFARQMILNMCCCQLVRSTVIWQTVLVRM